MTERRWQITLPNFFSIALLLLLALNYFAPFADLDYTWQIRTGAQIVHTGQLRPIESFTYTIAGRQVPEFEWLYEVLLWGLWSVWGYGGLKLLKTILVVTPLLLLSRRLRSEGVRWPGIAVSILISVFILVPVWNLRPLYCTTIGLLLVSGWLHDHCNGRKPLPAWLPLVMLLWANLHPGVIAGQGLLAGAIGSEWLNRWLMWNRPLRGMARWRLTILCGLGLAATFISPDPLERLRYPFRPEVAHPIQRIFVEMQPLYATMGKPPYSFLLIYPVAALVGLTILLRFRHYRLWEITLLIGLGVLANLAVRSLQDWLLVMLALGGPHVAILLRRLRMLRHEQASTKSLLGSLAYGTQRAALFCRRMLRSPVFALQPFWPAAAFALLAAASLIPPIGRQMPRQNGDGWPVEAADWMEAHNLEGRFYGLPDYGSYVTWRLGERARCYVDTRGFFFPPELLEDSYFVPQLSPDWRPRLERILGYGTDYFLLETTGLRSRLWHTLQPHVANPLYLDDKVVLLARGQVEEALAKVSDSSPAYTQAGRGGAAASAEFVNAK